ncbi:MAG: glycoside hydrolase family 3 N-terminal domain-containing protein [Acidimicrobiales bacterium]
MTAVLAAACTSPVTGSGARPGTTPPPVTAPAPPCRPAPLAERAAQVLIAGLSGATTSGDPVVGEVIDVGVGGVFLAARNVKSADQVSRLIADLRARSHHHLIVSTDEESGRVSSFAAVLGPSPSARRQAAERSADEVRGLAHQVGSKLSAFGVDLDLAPVADLDAGPYNATIGDRSFSADPATASRYASAQAAGFADAGVRSAVKHFPGHGRAVGDDEVGRSRVDASLADLGAGDLVPFRDLIVAGVPVVMVNHVEYAALDPGVPASLSPAAYRLLRNTGFHGVAITDALGMGAVNRRWSYGEAAVMALIAGADGVLVTEGEAAREMRDSLEASVEQGRLSEDRLNQAAARMAALGGVDPVALTCQAAEVPRLVLPPSPSPSGRLER